MGDVCSRVADEAVGVNVRLEVTGGQPVIGLVEVEGAEPVPFTGWLSLLALLERLAESPPSEPPAHGLGG